MTKTRNSLSIVGGAFHLLLLSLLSAAAMPQQQPTNTILNATDGIAAGTFIDNSSSSSSSNNNNINDSAGYDTSLPATTNYNSAEQQQQQQQPPQPQPQQQPMQYTPITALDKEVVERLIKQWAPIVWLAPEEKFMPLGVDEFLHHVHPMDKEKSFTPGMSFRDFSTKSHLVTNAEVQDLLENENSFIYGRNPNVAPVPIYGVVTLCPAPTQPPPAQQPPRRDSGAKKPAISLASTRGPYIPVSIDPLEERTDTVRRSSRLFPIFQRVKRDVIGGTSYQPVSEYDLVMGETQGKHTATGPPPNPETVEEEQDLDNSVPVNNFIANLADNVKFSGGVEDNLEDNSISEVPYEEQSPSRRKMPSFHVTYWMFYPYSQGKTMCTLSLGPLGRIPFPAVYGYCLGRRKDIGSHVGDWEHMSLYFDGDAEPQAMYVSAHDAGAYYSYNRLTGAFEFKRQETRKGILQRPNFPKTVTTFKDHPVLFAAKGSHGLWTAPGKHRFVKVARLYDINGFGTPWNTWKSVDISYENLRSYGRSLVPDWLTYRGKWGNPKSKCHPFRRIGLNFCELTDGPTGIPLKEPHFQCGADYR
ncbi:uncharacterized protein LOC115632105 [Scaptodrosophila lebanonensis]|uniref:Uncharacterized protein LOC115632105 n=1 Tax=Drosophila lebanonensis TaxID=7225 RepID=A0A6J2UBY8_DROLE|nr:uncharacterized protein LOC115632105 [Scaptodrosophila lebanonensis]